MRAWSGLRTQEPRNLRAWLYQVARNRCSDYLRSPQRRERIVGAEDHAHREPPGSGGCTPAPVGGGRDRRLGGGAGAGATGAAGVLSGRNEHRRDSRPPSLSARNGQATAVPRPRPGAQRIGHHQNEEGHYHACREQGNRETAVSRASPGDHGFEEHRATVLHRPSRAGVVVHRAGARRTGAVGRVRADPRRFGAEVDRGQLDGGPASGNRPRTEMRGDRDRRTGVFRSGRAGPAQPCAGGGVRPYQGLGPARREGGAVAGLRGYQEGRRHQRAADLPGRKLGAQLRVD